MARVCSHRRPASQRSRSAKFGTLTAGGAILVLLFAAVEAGHAQLPSTTRNATDSVRLDSVGTNDVVIRPGDVVGITAWPDAGLGGDFLVEETGVVYLPTLGEIRAAGIALRDFRQYIRELYREVMKMPVVSLTVRFRVIVVGAVGAPGIYTLDPNLTVFDAIALAGGFSPDARRDEVTVEREGQILLIDAQQALETGEAFTAIRPRSGDRVVVPRRRGQAWKRVFSLSTVYSAIQMTLSVASLVILLRQ